MGLGGSVGGGESVVKAVDGGPEGVVVVVVGGSVGPAGRRTKLKGTQSMNNNIDEANKTPT